MTLCGSQDVAMEIAYFNLIFLLLSDTDRTALEQSNDAECRKLTRMT